MVLGSFVAQSSGEGLMLYDLPSSSVKVRNNVIFVREPGNFNDPSGVQVPLSRGSCAYVLGHLKTRITSAQLLCTICDITIVSLQTNSATVVFVSGKLPI